MPLALAVVVVAGCGSGHGWVSGVYILKFGKPRGWAGGGGDRLLGFLDVVTYRSRGRGSAKGMVLLSLSWC